MKPCPTHSDAFELFPIGPNTIQARPWFQPQALHIPLRPVLMALIVYSYLQLHVLICPMHDDGLEMCVGVMQQGVGGTNRESS